MATNRHQAKLNRALTDEEQEKLRRKVWMIAAGLSMTFAFIYNKIIMYRFMGGVG